MVVTPLASRRTAWRMVITMHAHQGDRLVLDGVRAGQPQRVAVITELCRDDGTPPYVVRWLDDGAEALVFPGPNAHVERGSADGPI
jgi:hypothetical protein